MPQDEVGILFLTTQPAEAALVLPHAVLDNKIGWPCLATRRLIERGVRVIELFDVGSSGNWDARGDMGTHRPLAK